MRVHLDCIAFIEVPTRIGLDRPSPGPEVRFWICAFSDL